MNIVDLDNINENKKNGGRKKDDIRKYFELNDNRLCCLIDNCNKTFSLKTPAVSPF